MQVAGFQQARHSKVLKTAEVYGVHMVEIDLLRRGIRPFTDPRIPTTPYLVTLTRADAGVSNVWPLRLSDPLPVIPIPLRYPDADTTLDLGAAFTAAYDEAAYDLSLDYNQLPPPPAFSEAEVIWIKTLLQQTSS